MRQPTSIQPQIHCGIEVLAYRISLALEDAKLEKTINHEDH